MRSTRRLLGAVLAGLALVAAACGSSVVTSKAPSPGASGASGPSGPSTTAVAAAGGSNGATTVDTAGVTSPSGVTTYQVPPTAPDPGTTGPSTPDIAMVGPQSRWNGLLVVFLPGQGRRPKCCLDFLTEAASLGFHAIGLTYDNAVAVGARCLGRPACYGEIRRNLFDGATPGRFSAVPPRDTIEHRLVSLLSYLNALYPTGGWAPYLPSSSSVPDYARIVLAGHSDGGGEAAFIASVRAVKGVVVFSGPLDADSQDVAAPWLSAVRLGRATPAGRFYAFEHTGDPYAAPIRADWTAMGLDGLDATGGPVSVDTTGAPYGGAHELVSSATLPAVPLAAHDSTVVDAAQPRCPGGALVYTPVWRYLLQAAAGVPVTSSAPGCAGA